MNLGVYVVIGKLIQDVSYTMATDSKPSMTAGYIGTEGATVPFVAEGGVADAIVEQASAGRLMCIHGSVRSVLSDDRHWLYAYVHHAQFLPGAQETKDQLTETAIHAPTINAEQSVLQILQSLADKHKNDTQQ